MAGGEACPGEAGEAGASSSQHLLELRKAVDWVFTGAPSCLEVAADLEIQEKRFIQMWGGRRSHLLTSSVSRMRKRPEKRGLPRGAGGRKATALG